MEKYVSDEFIIFSNRKDASRACNRVLTDVRVPKFSVIGEVIP